MSQNPLLSGFDGYTAKVTALNNLERTFLSPRDSGGRVRALHFTMTFGTGTRETTKITAVGVLPKGARPLQVSLVHGVGGANATVKLATRTLSNGAGVDICALQDIAAAGTKVVPSAAVDTPSKMAVALVVGGAIDTAIVVSGTLLYAIDS